MHSRGSCHVKAWYGLYWPRFTCEAGYTPIRPMGGESCSSRAGAKAGPHGTGLRGGRFGARATSYADCAVGSGEWAEPPQYLPAMCWGVLGWELYEQPTLQVTTVNGVHVVGPMEPHVLHVNESLKCLNIDMSWSRINSLRVVQ